MRYLKTLFVGIASATLAAGVVLAEKFDTTTIRLTSVTTSNVLAQATSGDAGSKLYGAVHAIVVDVDMGSNTNSIDIEVDTISGDGLVVSRKLLSLTNASSDSVSFPRATLTDTAGTAISDSYDRIPLAGDRVRLRAYGGIANGTNVAATVAVTTVVHIVTGR